MSPLTVINVIMILLENYSLCCKTEDFSLKHNRELTPFSKVDFDSVL